MGNPPSDRAWFAQMLRGVACLSVVVGHLGMMIWQAPVVLAEAGQVRLPDRPISQVPDFSRSLGEVYQWTGINPGPFGVALFFLISGFVIGQSLDRTRPRPFLVGRAFRIYPTFLTCLGIVCIAQCADAWRHHAVASLSWKVVVKNTLLAPHLLRTAPVDGVVWTLEMETRFYILAAFLAVFGGLTRKAVLLGAGVILAIFAALAGYAGAAAHGFTFHHLLYTSGFGGAHIAFMLIGTCFYHHYCKRWRLIPFLAVTSALTCVALFGMYRFWIFQPATFTRDYLFAYAMALCLFTVCYFLRNRLPYIRILDHLANVSYPVYLLHGATLGYPLVMALFDLGLSPGMATTLGVAAVLIAASMIHRYVEAPSNRFGKHLMVRMSMAEECPREEVKIPGDKTYRRAA